MLKTSDDPLVADVLLALDETKALESRLKRVLFSLQQREMQRMPFGLQPKGFRGMAMTPEAELAMLDDLAKGIYSRRDVSLKYGTSERTVRRAIARARKRGDDRAFELTKSPAQSSLETSHTQGKDAVDSVGRGERGVVESPLAACAGSTEERTEGLQDRNEPGSGGAVLAADAGGGDAATTPPPAREIPKTVYTRVNTGHGLEDLEDYEDRRRGLLPAIPKARVTEPVRAMPIRTINIVGIADVRRENFFFPRGSSIGVDLKRCWVCGPKGAFPVSKTLAPAMNRLADGHLYDLTTLARVAEWRNPGALQIALKDMRHHLEAAGVQLVCVGKDMYRLEAVA